MNDINEVIASLAQIDNATAMIMENTKKEKNAYAEEIRQKKEAFDKQLSADIDEKVNKLKESLYEENQKLIADCKKDSEESLKNLDALFESTKEEWVHSIFNNVIKE